MAFTTFINIITAIFCFAVLVQSLRMMRSLDAVKGAGAALPQMITALDMATGQASKVLAELKETLSTDGSANAHVLSQAMEIRDELSVMVGIANATADRLVEESGNRRMDDGDQTFELSEIAA